MNESKVGLIDCVGAVS